MTIQMTLGRGHGLALLDVRGPLTADTADHRGRLAAAVARLADAGFADVAVSLAEVTRVDARGLGELVLARRAARARGARLRLVAPPPRVRRMLALTRLDTVLEVYASFGSFASLGPAERSAVGEKADETEELDSVLAGCGR